MDEDACRPRERISAETRARAKRLRKEATFPERLLWSRLRANQVGGLHFRRQWPIGPYILDFYCARAGLAIELDGSSHDEREEYDAARTSFLRAAGLRVLRFTNDEVLRGLDDVVQGIACECGLEV